MLLDQLPKDQPARIVAIDWDVLPEYEARRLRALGFDEGATVTVRHRGVFMGRDPLAVAIGRMMVGLRRVHARTITLEPVPVEERAALSAVPGEAP